MNSNQVAEKGITPLHLACYFGWKDCVELLLECKADIWKVASAVPLPDVI